MKTQRDSRKRPGRMRRGAASVELAAVLSLLCFVSVATCDYARGCRIAAIVASCARNGALYACDTDYAAQSGYTSTQNAALADASDLSPTPTVSSTTGTDGSGNSYVAVTVTYSFSTFVNYPGIPSSFNIARTVTMAVAPQ